VLVAARIFGGLKLRRCLLPGTLTVDLHPVFRSDRDIDNAVRSAIFRAVAQKVALLEIIPGKGSGTLKRRVLAKLAQPHLKKFYRRVEADSTNEGRILVHFDPPSSPSQTHAEDPDDELTNWDTPS
jgi:DNA-nicking Smr family endonuclease